MTAVERGAPFNCEEVVRALWDYLDGRCEEERRTLIEEHLALCEACRSHAEFEQKFMAKLAETGRLIGETADLRARVLRTLRREGMDDGAS